MKTKTLVLAALSAVVLAGCDVARDVFVPALPEVYWDYFPYEPGDSIVFSNGTEEMAFEIQSNFVDKENRTIYGVTGPITGRLKYAKTNFETKLNSSLLSMEGRVLVDKKQTVVKYEVAIVECAQAQEKLKWTYRFSDEMPYSDAPETVVLLENPDIQCNMDECGNKENNMHIESVVLEKGKGIASFYDANHDEEWVLKEIK